jgi:hypothetical protein
MDTDEPIDNERSFGGILRIFVFDGLNPNFLFGLLSLHVLDALLE